MNARECRPVCGRLVHNQSRRAMLPRTNTLVPDVTSQNAQPRILYSRHLAALSCKYDSMWTPHWPSCYQGLKQTIVNWCFRRTTLFVWTEPNMYIILTKPQQLNVLNSKCVIRIGLFNKCIIRILLCTLYDLFQADCYNIWNTILNK